MKKFKKLIPAMVMLLIATMLMGTTTYAWFSMNTTVTATGLQVKAKAEGGIVIAPYTQSAASTITKTGGVFYDTLTDAVLAAPEATAYKNTATMSLSVAELYPTSTANTTTWYHATSNDVNNYAATSDYSAMLTTGNMEIDGKFYTGTGADAAHEYEFQGQYFLYNKFSVKATAEGPYSLWVTGIAVTGETNSAALNNSMRIAIKVGDGAVAYFAPMYADAVLYADKDEYNTAKGTSLDDDAFAALSVAEKTKTEAEGGTLYFFNGTARTAGTPAKGTTPNTKISTNGITTTATDMEVWVYYEGEDENCKTINAVSIDTLNIQLTFSIVDPAA